MADGYERSSVRGIARRAGVDPALVYHYFDGKAGLFVALLDLARDPRAVMDEASRAGAGRGARIVTGFLEAWEAGGGSGSSRFLTAMQAVCASPEAAAALREFLTERVWSRHDPGTDPTLTLRRTLVASQLFGVAWQRYALRTEPLASATPEQIGAWVGPTVDRYLDAPLEDGEGVHDAPGAAEQAEGGHGEQERPPPLVGARVAEGEELDVVDEVHAHGGDEALVDRHRPAGSGLPS
jgi:AcrR family transcriptional regulator